MDDQTQRVPVRARRSGVRPLLAHRTNPAHSSTQVILIPPTNFGMVEDQLYRSGQPSELNFPFLEKLGLKSIVWLAPEDPNPRLCVLSFQGVGQGLSDLLRQPQLPR